MDTNPEIQTDRAEGPAPEPTPLFDYRGNGKVARLPKHLRDQINHSLADGLSCRWTKSLASAAEGTEASKP